MRSFFCVTAAAVALGGCALKGDVRRVEDQVQQLRTQTARADSARAAELQRIAAMLQRVEDSLVSQQAQLQQMHGDYRTDMTSVEQQLVQIQELTGQSQQRLSELRAQIQARAVQEAAPPPSPGADSGGTAAADTSMPGAAQLYELSLQQLRRGSPQTARIGFQKLLQTYPKDPHAADAEFFIGESWRRSNPDSAATAYEQVVKNYPDSPRAPTALYTLGLIAEQQGDSAGARLYYQRLLAGYPQSQEADLAKTKLKPNH